MNRIAAIILCFCLAACRQPTNAEVGHQSVRDAQPLAIMQASQRAHEASPAVVAQSAKGYAIQQAPSRM